MIKIGEMAKICGVSIQTLRYYDKLGLLRADYVDDLTGYRYYSPDKIAQFQTIAQLKAVDFSLDEIKAFLAADPGARLLLYGKKKEELEERMNRTNKKLRRIEAAAVKENDSIIPVNEDALKMPFEDDPHVIGRWEYCGDLAGGEKFSEDTIPERKDISLKTLFFLPGGSHIWTYFWTKGILYVFLVSSRLYVPNEYKLVTVGESTYMLINWMVDKCMDADASDCTRVYKQVDTRMYTERETHLYTDDTAIPYVLDDRVIGCWEAVDVVSEISEFSPSRRSDPNQLGIREIEFFSRGICVKRFKTLSSKDFCPSYRYTKGKILNSTDSVAEEYEIRTVSGEEYLIVQHKSADYSYLGRVFCHYVLKRKSSENEGGM